LNIEICDLFEIWCLRFGIFNTLVSFSIKLAVFQASGGASINLKKPTPAVSNGSVKNPFRCAVNS
jgi:hypothetical protein